MGLSQSSSINKRNSLANKSIKERAYSCIIGGFIADAASNSLNLIYNKDLLDKLQNNNKNNGLLEFYSPISGSSKVYKYSTGDLSTIGEIGLSLLNSIANDDCVDTDNIRKDIYDKFKEYKGLLPLPLKKFINLKNNNKTYDESSFENIDESLFIIVVFIPIIVSKYAGKLIMINKLECIVKILYNNNHNILVASKLIAKLLEKVILGMSICNVFKWSISEASTLDIEERQYIYDLDDIINNKFNNNSIPYSIAIESISLNGQIPGVIHTSFYALKYFQSYEVAVRANIQGKGDIVTRSWIISTFLAAESGNNCIPKEWKEKTNRYETIHKLTKKIIYDDNINNN